jgi:hypothetical protein
MTLRHDLAIQFWMLATLADRCDTRIVVTLDTERFAHAMKIGIGGRRRNSKTVGETEGL